MTAVTSDRAVSIGITPFEAGQAPEWSFRCKFNATQ
jgi:hypothetical protein